MKVYVITVDMDHECSEPVCAYDSEAKANAFIARVKQHLSRKPVPPVITGDPENNVDAHDAWWEQLQKWRKRHPAGEAHALYDDFTIHVLAVRS